MTTQLQLFRASRQNRIQVGLDDRTLDSLTRFARLAGYPRSRVVAELLQGVAPVMSEAADHLAAAQRLGDIGAISSAVESVLHSAWGAVRD